MTEETLPLGGLQSPLPNHRAINLPELQESQSISQHQMMCCSKTLTRESLDYNVKITFMSILMVFSMTGIIYNEYFGDKCSSLTPVLTGILTAIVGIFLPTPQKRK